MIRVGDIVKPSEKWIKVEYASWSYRVMDDSYRKSVIDYLRNECFGVVREYGEEYDVDWINMHPTYGAPYDAWWEPDELELVEHGLYEKYKRKL